MRWKIFGRKLRQKRTEKPEWSVLCTLEADSFDEAIEKARKDYPDKYYIVGAQPCEEEE